MDEFKVIYNLGWSWISSGSTMKHPFEEKRQVSHLDAKKYYMFELGKRHAQEYKESITKDLR